MITLSPKERFLKSPVSRTHADLVLSDSLIQAVATALLQMQVNQPVSADPTVAAASFHRMAGAREFVQTFLNLCEVEEPVKPVPNQNLPHRY